MDLYISDEHLEALYEDFGREFDDHYVLLMEEMAECIKALAKRYRYGTLSDTRASLIEEMAHVYICLEAVADLENITEDDIQMEIYKKEKEK